MRRGGGRFNCRAEELSDHAGIVAVCIMNISDELLRMIKREAHPLLGVEFEHRVVILHLIGTHLSVRLIADHPTSSSCHTVSDPLVRLGAVHCFPAVSAIR